MPNYVIVAGRGFGRDLEVVGPVSWSLFLNNILVILANARRV